MNTTLVQAYSLAKNPTCRHKLKPTHYCCANPSISSDTYNVPVTTRRYFFFGKKEQMSGSVCCGQPSLVFIKHIKTICTNCQKILFDKDVGVCFVDVCRCCGFSCYVGGHAFFD